MTEPLTSNPIDAIRQRHHNDLWLLEKSPEACTEEGGWDTTRDIKALLDEIDRLQRELADMRQAFNTSSTEEERRLRDFVDRVARGTTPGSILVREARALRGADEPLKMICNRHGAIIETGCPECETAVERRQRYAADVLNRG